VDHARWPNAFFAGQGLFTMVEARALASQSRCWNHQLESRVRENRMHGSEGGEGVGPFRPLSWTRNLRAQFSWACFWTRTATCLSKRQP